MANQRFTGKNGLKKKKLRRLLKVRLNATSLGLEKGANQPDQVNAVNKALDGLEAK